MKVLFKFFKRADKTKNRLVIPKMIVDKYGYDFYIEIYDDETIKLVPAKSK